MADEVKKEVKKRGPGKQFEKGNTFGNRGRPKTPAEVKEAFKELTMPAVWKLEEILTTGDHKVAIKAAEIILDRALGKAVQSVDLEGNTTLRITMDSELGEWAK